MGYGIRYQYGMLHQRVENGYQVETPDTSLREGFPWEVERIELAQTIQFGGRTATYTDDKGRTRYTLSLIHISEPTRPTRASRMPSSA